MTGPPRRVFRSDPSPTCACETAFDGDSLRLDARDCPGDGRLAEAPACRATAVEALETREAEAIVVREVGVERRYAGDGAALLVAAGRFAARARSYDRTLAERAREDPLGAARRAEGRGHADPVARLAAENGLAACEATDYGAAFASERSPALADARVRLDPPPDARFVSRTDLPTGGVVRVYEDGDSERTYHLVPPEWELDDGTLATLAAAHERLAEGAYTSDQAPELAAEDVADAEDPTALLARVLRKHTTGVGVLADVLADERVFDASAPAPVGATRLRVRVDGESMATNVTLTEPGAAALASRFRRESGRSLSQAAPTLDATATVADRRVRVAAVTDPLSDGTGFAFRAHDDDPWRLADLVANGTLPPGQAALLAVAVERGAAVLVAGPRGAGKTTLLGALLWTIPESVRTVVVEDTPELPADPLRAAGRDVQALRVASDDGPSVPVAEALGTALRLGSGALALGEVRDTEAASVLFDAMRVGAGDGAVLGTVHGGGASAVRERVVSEFGVSGAAFRAADCVVTLGRAGADRRLLTTEEVVPGHDTPAFEALYDGESTGRVDRGQSRLVASLAGPTETYADVCEVVADRQRTFGGER